MAYTEKLAFSLRSQQSVAGRMYVFVATNRFAKNQPYRVYSKEARFGLTSDTAELMRVARGLLDEVYVPGLLYKKCGITLADIRIGQRELFAGASQNLLQVCDQIKRKYGPHSIHNASTII